MKQARRAFVVVEPAWSYKRDIRIWATTAQYFVAGHDYQRACVDINFHDMRQGLSVSYVM